MFFECALALPDILDDELQAADGLSFRWYDVLVQLEEAGEGVPMNEIASRILASKSGLTRVIDRMEEAGLVRRERPTGDRRVVLVVITEAGWRPSTSPGSCTATASGGTFTEHLDERDLEPEGGCSRRSASTSGPYAPGGAAGGREPYQASQWTLVSRGSRGPGLKSVPFE